MNEDPEIQVTFFLLLSVISTPSKKICPEVGSINFKIVRTSVDLPHPDSPTRPNVSPSLIFKLTLLTALQGPLSVLKYFFKSLVSIIVFTNFITFYDRLHNDFYLSF